MFLYIRRLAKLSKAVKIADISDLSKLLSLAVIPQEPILTSFYVVQKFVLNVQPCFITPLLTSVLRAILVKKE